MLTQEQVNQIKDHLDRAQNPIFFFDNDQDGLCSFLLLQRYLGRGKGVTIKSFPGLDASYFRKVEELNSDYIFVLDKPVISKEFFNKAEQFNIPLVWIDHHDVDNDIPSFVSYYNPIFNGPSTNEPVTALCWQVTGRKEDLWIAVLGCISDGYLPEFYEDFKKNYEDLSVNAKAPFDVLYKSKIGELARILSGGLKDSTTNVVGMLKFLIGVKSPYEILEENSRNFKIHQRFKQINKKYSKVLEKAKKVGANKKKVLFFKYGGDLSVSAELANELYYTYPEKIIVVAHVKGAKVNLSLRGKNVREVLLAAISGIPGATGGGHKEAVGGQMSLENLDGFKKNFESLVKKG
jgi:single-stranded DNA-specific DHH superfamily exonuclease